MESPAPKEPGPMPVHPTARCLRPLRALVAAHLTADLPDRTLVERFAEQRDEAAFETLVRRHGPMVLRLCRRLLRHAQDAEDAFQATFLLLARKAASLRRREAVGAWLYGVARRVALKARVRSARVRKRETQVPERAAPDPLAEISVREAQDILDQELLRLPIKYQAPLLLCCLEGLTRDEAAARLGVPASTLKSRLEEGRERLRRRLAGRGLTLSAVLSPALLSAPSASAVLPARLLAVVRAAMAASAPSSLARVFLPALFGSRLKMAVLLITAAGLLAAGLAFAPVTAPEQRFAPLKSPPASAVAAPEQPEARKLDRLGDPLPPGARMRLGTLRHQIGPSFTFLPDGKTVLTVRGQALHWVDMEGGTSKRVWPLPPGHCFLGASADGRQAVLSTTTELGVWDTTTGRQLLLLTGGGAAAPDPRAPVVASALFAPGGQRIAGVGYGPFRYQVWLWDAREGRLVWEGQMRRNDPFRNGKAGMERPGGSPHVRFLPDGKTLGLLDDENHVLHLRDARTGKEIGRCGGMSPGESYSWAFEPDGNRLLVASPRRGLCVLTLKGGKGDYDIAAVHPEAKGTLLAFARDGKVLLLAGADGKLRAYDWPTGKLRRTLDLGGRTPTELLPARDGRSVYLLFAYEKTLRRYDLETGKETTPEHEGHRGIVSQFALAPDGKVVSAGYDGSVQVWDLARGRVVNAFRPKAGCIFADVSGDGKLVAGISWDLTEIAVHERDTGRLVRTIRTGKYVRHLSFAPHSRLLLSGEDIPAQVFRVWDADTGREVRRMKGNLYNHPAFSPDGRLLASCAQEQVRVLDFASGKEQFTLPDKGRHGLAFAPDGRTLACLDWKAITLWEMNTHKLRDRIELPQTDRTALRFSPDGCWLAWGEQENVHIWDLVGNRPLRTFRGHEGNVTDLRFTPVGRSLISANTDSTLLVWDVTALRRE